MIAEALLSDELSTIYKVQSLYGPIYFMTNVENRTDMICKVKKKRQRAWTPGRFSEVAQNDAPGPLGD